eukprot:gnl/TRDRNA2_/TRDRNA2_130646_c0_seq7.p1 gnl/TRDRNA2_/TRDRNA2_130646_c0~~gnl/TRDRNA2_/TRDRNA2_130646_c0_seq7.p1  ORF type:complete len:378 (-),score=79.50 gnl/TRDRNA2_/TRDRNA2_130646_c0_seq7:81-1214(-)
MTAKLYLMLGISLMCSVGANELPSFDSFIQMHGRSYAHGSAEYHQRRSLYEQRVIVAKLHNSNERRLWTAGVNDLWDWTASEMQPLRGWVGSNRPVGGGTGRMIKRHGPAFLQAKSDLPSEKIWSNLAMTHHVKNQGSCGSCWAIATASVLEAHTEIHTGKVRTFSAQQLVSCTQNPRHCGGGGGCDGATAELAMDFVMKNGCADDSQVPYAGTNGTCAPKTAMAQMFDDDLSPATGAASFGMTGWETLPKNKYEPLVRALAELGPVAVSVAADDWFSYESGIFDGCGKDAIIDHAVTAIGYGEENNNKYWVIQNSWGNGWGENGHIRLLRHDTDEYCGMDNDPQKGVACEGENDPVPVCGMCGILFDSVVPHFGKD